MFFSVLSRCLLSLFRTSCIYTVPSCLFWLSNQAFPFSTFLKTSSTCLIPCATNLQCKGTVYMLLGPPPNPLTFTLFYPSSPVSSSTLPSSAGHRNTVTVHSSVNLLATTYNTILWFSSQAFFMVKFRCLFDPLLLFIYLCRNL